MRDAPVDGSWNPKTEKNDLTITVCGNVLDRLYRNSVKIYEYAPNIPPTVRVPDSVFLAFSGNLVYCRSAKAMPVRPKGISPVLDLFVVRVNGESFRAFTWAFEASARNTPGVPDAQDDDRFAKRLK